MSSPRCGGRRQLQRRERQRCAADAEHVVLGKRSAESGLVEVARDPPLPAPRASANDWGRMSARGRTSSPSSMPRARGATSPSAPGARQRRRRRHGAACGIPSIEKPAEHGERVGALAECPGGRASADRARSRRRRPRPTRSKRLGAVNPASRRSAASARHSAGSAGGDHGVHSTCRDAAPRRSRCAEARRRRTVESHSIVRSGHRTGANHSMTVTPPRERARRRASPHARRRGPRRARSAADRAAARARPRPSAASADPRSGARRARPATATASRCRRSAAASSVRASGSAVSVTLQNGTDADPRRSRSRSPSASTPLRDRAALTAWLAGDTGGVAERRMSRPARSTAVAPGGDPGRGHRGRRRQPGAAELATRRLPLVATYEGADGARRRPRAR